MSLKKWGLPLLIFFIQMIAWCIVLFIGGTQGPYCWWFLIVFGYAGLIMLVVTTIVMLVTLIRHRTIRINIGVLLLLLLFASWPAGWFFGVGQIAYPSNVNLVEPSIAIRSPFNETAVVAWGGDSIKTNGHHVLLPASRWAYDLFVLPAVTQSSRLEDYGTYGVQVVAPVAGTIVGTYEGELDIEPGSEVFKSVNGNYVYIHIAETNTYLVIAHLKQGSVLVAEGQYVREGTPLGQAGNSGTTSEPHVHIHHQRQDPSKTNLLFAQGLPLYFRDVEGAAMPKGGFTIINGTTVLIGDTLIPLK